jgi:hypothetical protein
MPVAKVEAGSKTESVNRKAFILTAFTKKSQTANLESQI